MLKGVKSGSILLFHNDLENTTEALPQILTQLKSEGYEFVPVSELIYWDNYTIDSAGKQIPDLQSSIYLTPEKVEEVLAGYSEEIAAAGLNEDQILKAAEALKGGADIPTDIAAELPDNIREVIAQLSVDGDNDLDSLSPAYRTARAGETAESGDVPTVETSDPTGSDTPTNPDAPEETKDDINDVTFETKEPEEDTVLTPTPPNASGAVTEK